MRNKANLDQYSDIVFGTRHLLSSQMPLAPLQSLPGQCVTGSSLLSQQPPVSCMRKSCRSCSTTVLHHSHRWSPLRRSSATTVVLSRTRTVTKRTVRRPELSSPVQRAGSEAGVGYIQVSIGGFLRIPRQKPAVRLGPHPGTGWSRLEDFVASAEFSEDHTKCSSRVDTHRRLHSYVRYIPEVMMEPEPEPQPVAEPEATAPVVVRPARSQGKTPVTGRTRSSQQHTVGSS